MFTMYGAVSWNPTRLKKHSKSVRIVITRSAKLNAYIP